MNEEALLRRITRSPGLLAGRPTIRGHRVSVEQILEMLAADETEAGILAGWDWMEPDDIKACLLFGAQLAGRERADAAAG
ncbi:MAG: DUF433 domain-containing protein [Alphaproteobacteria bacterium]|nr:DUF433 domain-containing protein [Alphaproteobacteria bacterium]